MSLAKECYSMKLELLTNATVVDDAIRFVSESEKSKGEDKEREQVRSSTTTCPSDNSSNEDDNKESNEPDYDDEDENSDKVGREKQEHDTGQITTNQVF